MIYKKSTKISNICQLVNANLFTLLGSDTYVYAGITVTKNISAGTITFNGTSTSNFWYHVHDAGSELKYTNLIKGYKYYISGLPVNDLGVVFQLTSLFNLQGEQIFTAPKTSDGTGAFNIYVPKGVTLTDFVVTPQLFNLTEMYGKGYEPTTVEEFKNRWYKNLCDWNRLLELPVDSSHANVGFYQVVIDVEPNTAYTLSRANSDVVTIPNKVCYLGMDNVNSHSHAGNCWLNHNAIPPYCRKSITLTSSSEGKLWIFFSKSVYDVYEAGENIFGYLQLEKGSTATSYVPYTPNPAPYRPYCFVDSRKKAVKVSNIMQVISKPINGAGTTSTTNGITCEYLADGTGVTLTGTATAIAVFKYFTFWKPVSGHKYLWLYGRENSGESTAYFEIKWTDKNGVGHWFTGDEQIYTLSPTAAEGYATHIDFHVVVPTGQTCNGFTWHPQCFDLTEMYGTGNEPTTVEAFKNRWYKNLFSSSTEIGTLGGGYGPIATRNFEEGKWYIGLTSNNYYEPNKILNYEITESYVIVEVGASSIGFGLGKAFKCEPNQTYSFSTTGYIAAGYYDADGNTLGLSALGNRKITFTTPDNCKWFTVVLRPDTHSAVNKQVYEEIQLELGPTATDYVPYTPNPAPYTPYSFIKAKAKSVKVSSYMQLMDKSQYPATVTRDGITFTNNGDGTIVVNGTNTGSKGNKYKLQDVNLIGGHTYYINHGSGQVGTWGTIVLTINKGGTSSGQNGNIFTQPNSITNQLVYFYVGENAVIDNVTFKPQLFDLTEMYGAGNEPSTVDEFKNRWYKNLFSTSTEVGTLSGYSNTTPRQFEEGKWYVGLTGNNYYSSNNIVEYEFKENYVYMNTKGGGYGVGKAFKCEANQTYTVSCKWVKYTNTANIATGFYDENGNYLSWTSAGTLVKKHTITTPANCKWFTVCFVGITAGTLYVYNIQLEKGSTATSYVPYTPNPAPYKPHCFI